MTNVLILSAGRRVSLLREFRNELATRLPESKVFAADLNPALSSACAVSDRAFAVPRADDPSYVAAITSICIQHEITLVIPTIDTELVPLAHAKEDLAAQGITVSVSDIELVRRCRDKHLTAALFTELSTDSPRTYNLDEALPSPCFMKPANGSRSQGLRLFDDGNDVPDELRTDPRMMFMDYKDPAHHREYTADLFYDRHHILRAAVPRLRIETRDGEVNKAETVRGVLSTHLESHFAQLPGAVGCITAQFFVSEAGQVSGIEINPRFGGGYPLSYHAGANFPGWLIDEYLLDLPVASYDSWESGLRMLRYDDEVITRAPRP